MGQEGFGGGSGGVMTLAGHQFLAVEQGIWLALIPLWSTVPCDPHAADMLTSTLHEDERISTWSYFAHSLAVQCP